MKRTSPLGPLLAAAAVAVPALNAPPILWEWRNIEAARKVAAGGTPGLLLIHPPSAAYMAGAALRLLGDSTWALRVPGLACLLLSVWVAWAAALDLGLSAWAAWLACAVFATNPLAIQCALGLDFADGSLLTLSVALFFWLMFRRASWSPAARGALLGACLALCCWSKLATAFLLICAYTAAVWLARDRERRREWGAAMASGGLLFAATWALYCAWLAGRARAPWLDLVLEPFRYLTGSGAATPATRTGVSGWALYEVSSALYMGPLLLLAAAFGARRWAARRSMLVVPLFTAACLALYSVFLGGGRAYPKYFAAPVLPLALIAGAWLGESEPPEWGWLAAASAYYALLVGDFVYTLNFSLRLAQLAAGTRVALARLALQGVLYVAPVAALAFLKRASFKRGLAALLIGSQLGLSLAQLRGGYDLRQAYGASQRDFIETARIVREWPVDGPILADRGVVDAAGGARVEGYGSSSWQDLADIGDFIERQRPKAVVYGIALNTIDQLRAIAKDERLRALLSRGYEPRTLGSFSIWLRRPTIAWKNKRNAP